MPSPRDLLKCSDYPNKREYRRALTKRYTDLGVFLRDRGRYEESDEAFAKAIRDKEALIKDYPKIRDIRASITEALGGFSFKSKKRIFI